VDFTNGFHHRTRPQLLYNTAPKCRPDRHLFVANLSDAISDEDVRQMFSSKGFTLTDYFRKSALSAMVSLATAEDAVQALIAVHATVDKERYIKVSFSRFAPGPAPTHAPAGEDEGKASNEEETGGISPNGDEVQ
jgi:hypothetical protein